MQTVMEPMPSARVEMLFPIEPGVQAVQGLCHTQATDEGAKPMAKKGKYLVIVDKAKGNYSAYSPEVLGCVATGATVEKTIASMKEALEFHLEGSREIPPARTDAVAAVLVDVPNVSRAKPRRSRKT
jgi:predicted RNase H-like HicB family nuclease